MKIKLVFWIVLTIIFSTGTLSAQNFVRRKNSKPTWLEKSKTEKKSQEKAKREKGGNDDQQKTPVILIPDSDIYIGKYEVTQERYELLMGENPSFNKNKNRTLPNHPVENVTREKALEYCAKLTKYELDRGWIPYGYEYTLPTREDWLVSWYCKKQAKFNLKYYTRVAWFYETSGGETHPVGRKIYNEIRIHDMAGNVAEMTLDGYLMGGSFDDCGYMSLGHPHTCSCGRKKFRELNGKIVLMVIPKDAGYCKPRRIEEISSRNRAPSRYVGFRVCLTNKKENFASEILKR